MNNLVITGLVDTGLCVNGERVFLKNDRKVVVRGNAVVVLAGFDKPASGSRFDRRPRRKIRTNWTPVTVDFKGGQFNPDAKAPVTAPGRKTNIGAGTAKGPGGTKPGRGTSNPKLAAKRARKAAQRK